MRISDWSSDVCSSDLRPGRGGGAVDPERYFGGHRRRYPAARGAISEARAAMVAGGPAEGDDAGGGFGAGQGVGLRRWWAVGVRAAGPWFREGRDRKSTRLNSSH